MCSEETLALPGQWSVLVSGAAVLMAARPRPRSWLSASAVRGSPALLRDWRKKGRQLHTYFPAHIKEGGGSQGWVLSLSPNLACQSSKKKKRKKQNKNHTIGEWTFCPSYHWGGTWSDCYYSFFSTCSLGRKLSNLEHSIPEEQVLMLRVKGTHLC